MRLIISFEEELERFRETLDGRRNYLVRMFVRPFVIRYSAIYFARDLTFPPICSNFKKKIRLWVSRDHLVSRLFHRCYVLNTTTSNEKMLASI